MSTPAILWTRDAHLRSDLGRDLRPSPILDQHDTASARPTNNLTESCPSGNERRARWQRRTAYDWTQGSCPRGECDWSTPGGSISMELVPARLLRICTFKPLRERTLFYPISSTYSSLRRGRGGGEMFGCHGESRDRSAWRCLGGSSEKVMSTRREILGEASELPLTWGGQITASLSLPRGAESAASTGTEDAKSLHACTHEPVSPSAQACSPHPTTRARQEHRLELSPSSPQRDHDLQRRRMILFPGLETVNPRPEDGRKSFFLSCPTPAARRGGALWEHTLCFRQRLFSPQKSARIRTAARCHASGKVGVSFTLRGTALGEQVKLQSTEVARRVTADTEVATVATGTAARYAAEPGEEDRRSGGQLARQDTTASQLHPLASQRPPGLARAVAGSLMLWVIFGVSGSLGTSSYVFLPWMDWESSARWISRTCVQGPACPWPPKLPDSPIDGARLLTSSQPPHRISSQIAGEVSPMRPTPPDAGREEHEHPPPPEPVWHGSTARAPSRDEVKSRPGCETGARRHPDTTPARRRAPPMSHARTREATEIDLSLSPGPGVERSWGRARPPAPSGSRGILADLAIVALLLARRSTRSDNPSSSEAPCAAAYRSEEDFAFLRSRPAPIFGGVGSRGKAIVASSRSGSGGRGRGCGGAGRPRLVPHLDRGPESASGRGSICPPPPPSLSSSGYLEMSALRVTGLLGEIEEEEYGEAPGGRDSGFPIAIFESWI
ncbi:unnamed protein product [Diplocarpon coronariae]